MQIKYISGIYQQSTFKFDILGGGGEGIEMLWNRARIFYELTKATWNNYCSLLTSVLDPWNFGTDPYPRIRSQKKDPDQYKNVRIFDKNSFLFGCLGMQGNSKIDLFAIRNFSKWKKIILRKVNKYFVHHPKSSVTDQCYNMSPPRSRGQIFSLLRCTATLYPKPKPVL
jgi:hypothetical protein